MRFLMIFNHCVKWPFYRILWYILSDLVICSKLDTMQWTGSRRLVILKLWNSVLLFSHLLWRKTFWWIIAGCQVQEHEGSLRVHTLQHTAAPPVRHSRSVLLIVRRKTSRPFTKISRTLLTSHKIITQITYFSKSDERKFLLGTIFCTLDGT